MRTHLFRITGVDLLALPGLSASGAQTLVAEIGADLTAFPSAKHFCSWLGLAPHNDISGGKVLRSYRLKNHNRAGQVLIQAAAALIRSDSSSRTLNSPYFFIKRAQGFEPTLVRMFIS